MSDSAIAAIARINSRISEIESATRQAGANVLGAKVLGPSTTGSQAVSQPVFSVPGISAPYGEIAPSGVDTRQFATDLLNRVGAPVTDSNVTAIRAWIKAEGTKADFNPLATVRKAPGATDFNKVGVKNFTNYAQGVEYTAQALQNGLYGNVLQSLYQGTSSMEVADAIENSPWGSGSLVKQVLNSWK